MGFGFKDAGGTGYKDSGVGFRESTGSGVNESGFGLKGSSQQGSGPEKKKSVAGPTAEDQRRITEALKAGRIAAEKQQAQQAQKGFEEQRQWDQKQWEQRQQDDQRAFESRQREDQQAYEARLQQARDQQT